MKSVLLEILKDCDDDIRTKLLETDGKHAVWEYLENAPLVALTWQQLRNTNKLLNPVFKTSSAVLPADVLREPGKIIKFDDKPQ